MLSANELLVKLGCEHGNLSIEALSRVLLADYLDFQVESNYDGLLKNSDSALEYVQNILEFLCIDGDEKTEFWNCFNDQLEKYIINCVDLCIKGPRNMDAEHYDELLTDVALRFADTFGNSAVAWKHYTVEEILDYKE